MLFATICVMMMANPGMPASKKKKKQQAADSTALAGCDRG